MRAFDLMPGNTAILIDGDMKEAGEVVVERYLRNEQSYEVWWTYPQTGEREMIKVEEWRLHKKRSPLVDTIQRMVMREREY